MLLIENCQNDRQKYAGVLFDSIIEKKKKAQ